MNQIGFRAMSFVLLVALAAPLAVFAQTKPLASKENREGQVTITVTPVALSKAANAWRFEVQLNTHVAALTQDLVAVSALAYGEGHEEQPSAWEGDPPGGHHRKGVLIFKPIDPPPASITLHIRQIGEVKDRSFTWDLTNP